jgi:hypothetical protein
MRHLLALALLAFTAACAGDLTGTGEGPVRPSLDSDLFTGSGNRAEEPPARSVSDNESPLTEPCTPTTDSNGLFGGSGNDSEPVCPQP